MPPRPIHTERLDLIPWAPEHAHALANFARQPGIPPSIARDPQWDPQHPEVLSGSLLHHWDAHGFGWRAISERAAAVIIGFVGVTYLGRNDLGLDPCDLELGCWVHPAHWRRGLAAEASTAVIDHAFLELGATSVMGCAASDHRASIDGATMLGLQVEHRVPQSHAADLLVMRVTVQAWTRRPGAAARR
ncbi:MAG: GNAT family N-acetyltransferase [Solirubrobacteraceae bacterium]|nr:GNAT family N-acetyltransferase [Solirubrobacteraceae bacterium]